MNRSTEGLRDVLFNELEGFLAGNVDSEHVKTVTSDDSCVTEAGSAFFVNDKGWSEKVIELLQAAEDGR